MIKKIFSLIIVGSFLNGSVSYAELDLSRLQPEKVVTFAQKDQCFITKKSKIGNYSEKDIENESKLCSLDYENSRTIYAACPKLHNTNPAMEIHILPEGSNKVDFIKNQCKIVSRNNGREAMKIAKFKSSVSCSYTPSLLSYYHVSRILGNILNIPVAVLKTENVQFHLLVSEKAKQSLSNHRLDIYQTWALLQRRLKDPSSDSKSKYMFTKDNQQTFGALVFNPNGESDWTELSNDAGGVQEKRAEAFKKTSAYRDVINSESVASFISKELNSENLQRMNTMEDVSDMLIIDTLLRQEDRYNNIAFKPEYFLKLDAHSFKKISKKDLSEFTDKRDIIEIKKMLLKDNDCGVAADGDVGRTNINEKMGIIQNLKHVRPETYFNLLKLEASLGNEMKDFFQRQTLMTENDYKTFERQVKKLSSFLRASCKQGTLNLDLDVKSHFSGKSIEIKCDL